MKRIGSFDFDKVLKKLEVKKKEIPVLIANNSLNFFDENWRRQGFLDKSIEKWKPRKPSKSRKPILVKTGRLRRSLRVKSATFHRIEIITDVPYAQIQNEGGVIKKPASKKTMHFKKVDGFKNVRGKKTVVMGLAMSTKKKATKTMNVSVKAYQITIPARPFMKPSYVLDRKNLKILREQIDQVFPKGVVS